MSLVYNNYRSSAFAMGSQREQKTVIRYRGFLLLEEHNKSWLVRPERSPMLLLPFRTHTCSVREVKKILDAKLLAMQEITKVA